MKVEMPMQITGIKLKKATLDSEGMVKEPAKVVVQIETPVFGAPIDELTRMFEQNGECVLETPQMELFSRERDAAGAR